jgi:hypothetical protein
MEVTMPTFTLTEQEADGDFFQPRKPKRGDPWLVIERRLNDCSGSQVGTFTVRGTFMTKLRRNDAVICVPWNEQTYRPGRYQYPGRNPLE